MLAAGAAGAALAPAALSSAQQTATAPSTAEQFAGRVLEDFATSCRGALCYMGDRLGVFKAMVAAGPVTSVELGRKTKLNARMLREWLNAMAAAEYIEYRPADKRYVLSKEHALVLTDEENSPLFLGGMLELLVPMVAAANKVAGAFQTGIPITMDDFGPELFEGMERASAPAFKHSLVQKWIAGLPQVEAKLRAGGTAVDVGCGSGLASIVLAKAFPKARCFGYDPHAPSIERARANARKAGVGDRAQFLAADSSKLPTGRFDLLTIFNALHHFSDPVGLLAHCRMALAPEGTCFIVDGDLSPKVEENMNMGGRLSYGATTLWCLQDSMANNGAGLGSELGEAVVRDLARKSGFNQFKKLPDSIPLEAYYELRA